MREDVIRKDFSQKQRLLLEEWMSAGHSDRQEALVIWLQL